MENIGDWLYVVFIIIAALSSLLGSRKKNKDSKDVLTLPGKRLSPPPPDTPDIPSSAPKRIPRPDRLPPVPSIQKHEPAQAHKQPASVPFLAGESTRPSVYPVAPQFPSDIPEEPAQAPAAFSFEGDDLRKAVIYSEILQRKF